MTEYRDKLRSLSFGVGMNKPAKVTVDEISKDHKNVVTEHWDDRVDVNIHPAPIKVKPLEGT